MNEKGFTLLELLIVLAIVAIFATLAAPAFDNLIVKNRVESQANLFVSSLALARSEALKSSTQTSLCTSSNGVSCNNGSWSDGWIVFIDENGNASVDGNDRVLKVFDTASDGYTFNASAAIASSITYLTSGELNSEGGNITICGPKGRTELGHQVMLNSVGRPRVNDSIGACS